MTQELDLARLRKVAEAATPGPWEVYDRGIGYEVHDANGCELNGGMRETFTEADANHIATFDPPTVLALLSRLEAAEQELARIRPLFDNLSREYPKECNKRVAAEKVVARVREVATGDPTEYGWSEAMLAVLRALDGESNE